MSVLRVVSIGSRSGTYGGPFDTAKRQVRLAQGTGLRACLWAGTLAGDEPDLDSVPEGTVLVEVRNWLPRLGFISAVSWRAIKSLYQEVGRCETIHISYCRELIPLLAALIAVLRRKKLVIQPHGMLTNRSSWLHSAVDLLAKPIFRASSCVIALTDVEKRALARWIRPSTGMKWVVMGNPVGQLPTKSGTCRTEPPRREALWVARLHPRKRIQDFLDAATLSRRASRAVDYVVIGPDGGQLPDVVAAVARGSVAYEGAVSSDAVTQRLSQTGVFVLTSLNEPWGNVLATALSLGVPVVVTKSSALAPSIEQFDAGLVVEDESPFELDLAIAELLDSRELYSRCSEGASRLTSALLSQEVLQSNLAELYSA